MVGNEYEECYQASGKGEKPEKQGVKPSRDGMAPAIMYR